MVIREIQRHIPCFEALCGMTSDWLNGSFAEGYDLLLHKNVQ